MNLIVIVIFMLMIFGTSKVDFYTQTSQNQKNGFAEVSINEKEHTLINNSRIKKPWEEEVSLLESNKQENNIDEVEGMLIRACKVVHTYARYERCSDSSSTKEIWAFVGTPGTKGNLKEIWEGKKSSSFSCSTKAEYGRKLVADALPYNKVQYYENGMVKPLTYDFSDMTETHGDPCAYIDFVGKY